MKREQLKSKNHLIVKVVQAGSDEICRKALSEARRYVFCKLSERASDNNEKVNEYADNRIYSSFNRGSGTARV